ncbi:hypothetical protein PRVXH_001808 [Proteinivorax hydrogeniformans]|uniref:Uncharacterized protein n=1 Tax=Proteinivorax hydrogeniformans TaxID=1826727 RepID=A0AAU8HRD7_9FIRM
MILAALISYGLAAIFVGRGFYKMYVYDSGYNAVNAYVGGDAYNYIINSNYATGYFTLAILCAVIGATFVMAHYLSVCIDKKEKSKVIRFEEF